MNIERPTRDPDFMKIPPEPIYEFRKLSPSDQIFLPESRKNRKLTDVGFLIAFGIFVLLLIILSIYILLTINPLHLLNGRDECGNICGVDNRDLKVKEGCAAMDYSKYPVLLFAKQYGYAVGTKCITAEDCYQRNSDIFFGRCFPDDSYQGVDPAKYRVFSVHIKVVIGGFAMILFTIFGFLLLYVCFRLHARATFYTIVVVSFIMYLGSAIYLWYFFAITLKGAVILPAVLCTVYVVVLLCLLIFRKRLKLVIHLFEEASGIIFKSPLLLVLPLLTVVFIVAVIAAAAYLMIQLTTHIEDVQGRHLGGRICFMFVLLFMALWLVSFAMACQDMVVAGTAAAYYFNRDKSIVFRPFFTSMFNMLRFHLGTIAFGSLVIALVTIPRALCKNARAKNEGISVIILLCLKCLEEIVEYLCVKAYIMTAIHGRPLFTSGKRAMRLLWLFLVDTLLVDVVSITIIRMIGCFIVLIALLIGYFIIEPAVTSCFPEEYSTIADLVVLFTLLFLFYICIIVMLIFTTVMTVVVETLFVCFCEDKLMNDGSMAHPYFMSKRLLQLMTEAWELTEKNREKKERKLSKE